HPLDRSRSEDPPAVERAALEQHLCEPKIILGSAREAAGTGEIRAAERPVDRHERVAVAPIQRRDTPEPRFVEVEARVAHAERLEEPRPQELVVRLPARNLDDPREHVEAREPAVPPERSRLEIERELPEPRDIARER